MPERRKFRRVRVPVHATAFTGNEQLDCAVEDLSGSGAALRVDHDCEPGRFVRLLIELSPDQLLEVDAVVVRCEKSGDHAIWGTEFVDLGESKTRSLLRTLAAHVRADSWRPTKPPPSSSPMASSRLPAPSSASIDVRLRALYRAALVELTLRTAPRRDVPRSSSPARSLLSPRTAPHEHHPEFFGSSRDVAIRSLRTEREVRLREPIPTLVDEFQVASEPEPSRTKRDRCLLTITIGPEFAGVHRLTGSELVLGRGDDVDVRVADPFVSQRHVRFVRGDGGSVYVEDLRSRNGTYVGATRVTKARRLRDGDYVRLSRQVLVRCGFHDELSEKTVLALYQSSTTDALTGAHNRRYFESRLEAEVCSRLDMRLLLALLLFDVDRFKSVNDTHGHAIGDGVLRVLSESVGRVLRPEDLFARYAGDEFLVLARATTLRNGEILAERLRRSIEELALDTLRPKLRITSSIGVAARTPTSSCSAPLLVALADRAMYRAKAAGGNRVVAIEVP